MGTSVDVAALVRILEGTLRRHGQKQIVAKALGVTPSRYSKILKALEDGTLKVDGKKDGDGYFLGIRGCLRLAKASGQHPSHILRAAGKAEVADLIEELYGGSVDEISRMIEEQAPPDLLLGFRAMASLDEDIRAPIADLAVRLSEHQALRAGTRSDDGPVHATTTARRTKHRANQRR